MADGATAADDVTDDDRVGVEDLGAAHASLVDGGEEPVDAQSLPIARGRESPSVARNSARSSRMATRHQVPIESRSIQARGR